MTTKENYLNLYANTCRRPQWLEQEKRRTLTAIELDDGTILPIHKYGLKKDFCFGESGYDLQDAIDAANHARTSADYFRSENLEDVMTAIANIKDTAGHTLYFGKNRNGIAYMNVYSESVKWNYPHFLIDQREASEGERAKVLEALEQAKADLSKRIDTYLKRYGTSKVHAWTYWRDA